VKTHDVPVVLVGCSATKALSARPAKDLYTGPLFRLSRAYAERRGLPWAILSALHGLVMPDEVLDPYELSALSLRARGKAAHKAWGEKTADRIEIEFPGARFVFLAGQNYRPAVERFGEKRVSDPMKGLGIGRRLQWLRREAGELAAVPA
jgi:hypothetical protein